MPATNHDKPTEGPPTSVGPLVTSGGASATEGTLLHDMHVLEKVRPEPPKGLNAYEKRRWEQQERLLTQYGHQLLLLRLQGEAAEAFRTGQDSQAPSMQDINTANKNFERILDEIGKSGGKLARHYKIRVQDIQRSLH